MSEKNLARKLMRNMQWDEGTRHEDAYQSGIADVSFCAGGLHGWLELKFTDDWPARSTTIVRPKHPLTYAQKEFLTLKGKRGGNTWVLWQIGDSHLLYDWTKIEHIGMETRAGTLNYAIWHTHEHRLNYQALLEFFSGVRYA